MCVFGKLGELTTEFCTSLKNDIKIIFARNLKHGVLAFNVENPVHSLQCYTCAATTNIADCNTNSTCLPGSAYCMKVEATTGGVTAISKSCEMYCTEGSASTGGVSGSVHCCNTDLCNGAASVKISPAVLSLAAGVSVILLRAAL
ncbi:lymphocyte antigen 6E-like [Ambystoma mexicanum]|uniref:lymphocyte antigen 6E-like n=1 Tax=Ambystoma mexicanum TaxID=8296 RepID=UPI0037E83BC5